MPFALRTSTRKWSTSLPMQTRKKPGPVPSGHLPPTSVRLPAEVVAGLDAWIAMQPDPKPRRAEALRHALREWLGGLGLVTADGDGRDTSRDRRQGSRSQQVIGASAERNPT